MKEACKGWLPALYGGPWISPLGLLKLAVALTLLYSVLAAASGREYVGFLSGTRPAGEQSEWWTLFGLLYVLIYFAFVLAVPILLLGAAFFAVLARLGVPPKE
jgi:hypothetical protein